MSQINIITNKSKKYESAKSDIKCPQDTMSIQRSDTDIQCTHATRLCSNKKTTFPTQYFWARGKWQRNVDYVEIVWVLGWAGLKYEVWLDRLELYLNFSCTHFSRSLLIWKLSVSGPQLPTSELECHRTAPTSAPACVAEKPERVSPSLSTYIITSSCVRHLRR